mmetsp:Transcript_104561/g.223477  ORF Transcript_104561/g.223477 Transcript_104561/m.223477 type:complete len:201 (-) Transcript_104561:519-1121(-)
MSAGSPWTFGMSSPSSMQIASPSRCLARRAQRCPALSSTLPSLVPLPPSPPLGVRCRTFASLAPIASPSGRAWAPPPLLLWGAIWRAACSATRSSAPSERLSSRLTRRGASWTSPWYRRYRKCRKCRVHHHRPGAQDPWRPLRRKVRRRLVLTCFCKLRFLGAGIQEMSALRSTAPCRSVSILVPAFGAIVWPCLPAWCA